MKKKGEQERTTPRNIASRVVGNGVAEVGVREDSSGGDRRVIICSSQETDRVTDWHGRCVLAGMLMARILLWPDGTLVERDLDQLFRLSAATPKATVSESQTILATSPA